MHALSLLHSLLQQRPDSVVITYVGLSNDAGPTLAAHSSVPVIAVPATPDFPNDVWSSLRTPSNVPLATVLKPANAIELAMTMLSARNPRFYALLALEREERLTNFFAL